ncbi:MAG: ribonuclease R [Patescibacteria group bacterium]|nr:ribonuclease R [Patescibacteria group bacterium]MDE2218540.1 ribonuclease R [Patescibacteria group bacterium]
MQTVKKHDGENTKISGTISLNSKGVGFVSTNLFKEDIEIPTSSLNTAMNKDEVEILIHPALSRQKRRLGEVLRIIKRAKENFVGILEKENGEFFLVPDDKKMYVDILIRKERAKGALGGEKVLAKIIKWDDSKKTPEGEIIEIIGKKGDHNVEMKSIVFEKGFEIEFPREVEKEASEIEVKEKIISESEISKRRDFRNTLTFTIDPADAKDFDDAISLKKLADDKYEVGVHIADVSHYVREGTAINTEARKRGFSVYLVDRTIPMLPEVLSNDICSLNPMEEKLSFSAVFVMDKNGNILERWFGKTIIKSDKRFSYEEAQKMLDAKSGEHFEVLNILNLIAKKLRDDKFKKGAIDFEQDEVKFELDENGKPLRIYIKKRLDTHKLVEEFMLLANKEVAEFIFKANRKMRKDDPFIYRIHDVPDREKIEQLSVFLKALGYELELKEKTLTAKDLQMLFKLIEGKAEESMIKTAAIRSMAKAVYSTKNIGHFGLAFEYYTHFTSPIRRYADLLVHRLLEKHLQDKSIPKHEWNLYEKMAMETTEKEIAAAEAERNSKKYKQVEYMKEHVGEVFEGVISGVTEWGLYVEEIDTKSDGMVSLRNLTDDFYVLDEKNYALVGEKTKKRYGLGDKAKVKLLGADMDRRTLDYVFAE